ncbi:hypothetical protein KM043_003519 [Ampulex compressa]|nr:hypothetical protein KM043_003519 [Ampulex compressa]
MKTLAILGYCLLCLFASRAHSKPQITKLFPVQELIDHHQQVGNEVKPLDKFLGKLRATYDFVFRKPENTSNVEKILMKDDPDPDLEAFRLIWSDDKRARMELLDAGPMATTTEDWFNDVQPLMPLELQEEGKEDGVEVITPATTLQLPATLGRHLIEWLGSLLGLTYSVYAKLVTAVHPN